MRSRAALLTLTCLVLAACGGDDLPQQSTREPAERGLDAPPVRAMSQEKATTLLETVCSKCHSNTPIKEARLTLQEWVVRLEQKKCRKAIMPRTVRRQLVHYLASNYGR